MIRLSFSSLSFHRSILYDESTKHIFDDETRDGKSDEIVSVCVRDLGLSEDFQRLHS